MFNKIFYALICVLLPVCGANSYAQETASEKKELIRELLVLMETRQSAVAVMDLMADQMQKDVLGTLNRPMEGDRSLTTAERAERQRAAAESAQHSADRFKELFKQRVDYAQLVEDVSYELYDKYLTADEMRYLITFYKSETGRKMVKIMPQLFSETMAAFGERLTPVLQEITQEILEEEQNRVKSVSPVNKVAPGNRRPARRAGAPRRRT